MKIVDDLLSCISNFDEIENCMEKIDSYFEQVLKKCYNAVVKTKSTAVISSRYTVDIETVLDFLHDELNTGHWSQVPLDVRQAFTAATFIKAVICVRSCEKLSSDVLKAVLKSLDMGLLLGAPLNENCDLLKQCATCVTKELMQLETLSNPEKPKNNMAGDNSYSKTLKRKSSSSYTEVYEKLPARNVEIQQCPSVQHFSNAYFEPQIPVKVQDCMSHWPASKKWTDVNYLLKVAGERTIPIEIGSHYADENWSQKLMTLKEFIKSYYLESTDSLGYLAQHTLFDQIPELKEDIRVPEYCCLSKDYDNTSCEPDINAWFGPANTVSPLHYDPKDNLLAQIFGSKQVLLFAPSDSSYLYPHEDKLLCNTAQVNPLDPDLMKFPEFSKATMYKCLLQAGEMLFIPSKWWHHVTALSKSFSVSFWWQ